MITKDIVEQIIAPRITADGNFIVEITVTPDNVITVVVDSKNGISIDYCVELSRLIEASLNRDVEDYELQVSSAGIGCELKVPGQFEKNIGNQVEVTRLNGSRFKGTLTDADAEGFGIEVEEKIKEEGSKKKTTVLNTYRYKYDEVKTVKDIISFK
ncbi:MAG: ribosome assembly cofactor RimP [Bacteroidales bacterium]|nr:ribosome assembly cofactor RimP [Bacteroidales bacterium]